MLTLQDIRDRLDEILDTWHDQTQPTPRHRILQLAFDIDRTIDLCRERLLSATPLFKEPKP